MPIVKNDLIVFKKKLKNELLLRTKYSLDRTNFKLNACAKTFYELCDGEKTCEDIIKEMNRRFPDVPIDVIQRDFEKTLKELHKRGIIGWKNGINAFADEMEDKINKSVSYCTCDYNEVPNLASYRNKFDTYYLSPYYGEKFLVDNETIETYIMYNNMFIFQYKVNGEVTAEVLCESNYIDYSIQLAYMSYDSKKVRDEELFDFFNWIMRMIIKCTNVNQIDEKYYLFCYIDTNLKECGFLKGFQYHGILKNEIKGKGDIGCYTYCH